MTPRETRPQVQANKKFMIPYWWKAVFAFTLGWMFINANKYFLNPILGEIGLEYNLNNTQLGLVNSIFFLTYTIAQIPAGAFSDKFGRKKLLVTGFIIYGILTGVSGLMAGFTGFLVARALAGLSSATYFGPQFALSSEAIPEKNRTVGSAIINSGSGLGIAFGFILSSTLVLENGMSWSVPFYIFGVLTVLVGILIAAIVKEKNQDKTLKQSERLEESSTKGEKVSVLSLLKNRNLLITFLVLFCSIYGFTVVVTWLPKFLETERGFRGYSSWFDSSVGSAGFDTWGANCQLYFGSSRPEEAFRFCADSNFGDCIVGNCLCARYRIINHSTIDLWIIWQDCAGSDSSRNCFRTC